MPDRRHRPLRRVRRRGWQGTGRLPGLALALLLAGPFSACAAEPAPARATRATYVATHIWRMDDQTFGGFSGIEIGDDGRDFIVISDRAEIRWGSILRDAEGRITAMEAAGRALLRDENGDPLPADWQGDSEGLARAADGTLWISFEGTARIARYATPDSPGEPLPRPPEFDDLQRNSSFEALAIAADGTLLTLPERSGRLTRPFPVWRWRDGAWDQPFAITRSGDWLPVGADIGPDGRLYLLERDFRGLLGFRSRVRRFDLSETGVTNEAVLLESGPLQYDNLEGISVWSDGKDIRITLISDDNFRMFQRTELVEYRVQE
ncbi:hypothetical protein SAMN04487972_12214 [Paracoccus halophilus]|uniref:ABC-type cobalamin/Fe3+-siderophores transport system, ATPase component n=1 Tax=Paracoccus halophilus TaxID=376733 RepID=A0A099EZK2_9RHOB|nr:esterase-like activity of phytase family protein [Paracoccus halophilus]KGJ03347.1 ABC-type cobalamin/Fe3+-siderophores transport system, ATPase component [Paracoccus halophilus]SFA58802.1 hypothetical protein SAMN04487972_12214 [Paracoccus halophilus]